ncbi:Tetratricopeptide repeat protein 16 [Dinochytrium kinnereticum]|nr:Tetratricopeptide repeat protein 16 [Dinochytrium kinnereticum]
MLYVLTSRNPNNVELFILRAKIYRNQGNVDFVNIDTQTAVQLQPSHPEIKGLLEYIMLVAIRYKNKASDQILKGQFDVAIYFLNHALELDPMDWVLLFKRGILFSEIGHFESAIVDLSAVLEHPEYDKRREGEIRAHLGSVYNKLGVSLFQNGNYGDSLVAFTTALSFNPSEPVVYKNRADCYLRFGMVEKTLKDLSKARELDDNDEEARSKIGSLRSQLAAKCLALGDISSASVELSKAIAAAPSQASYYFERAKTYMLQQMIDAARSDLESAVELEPGNKEASALLLRLQSGPPLNNLLPFPPRKPLTKSNSKKQTEDVNLTFPLLSINTQKGRQVEVQTPETTTTFTTRVSMARPEGKPVKEPPPPATLTLIKTAMRRVTLGLLLISLLPAAFAINCKDISIGDNKYDISLLSDELFKASRSEELPPTKNKIDTFFSLCKAWTPLKDIAAEDQCDKSTFVCEITTNVKESAKEKERVISVKPWTDGKTETFSQLEDGFAIKYGGGKYNGESLVVMVNLICSKDVKKGEPEILSVNKTTMEVRWKSSVGCKVTDAPKAGEDKKGMSGTGVFFLLLFIGVVCYFAIGTVYNYSVLRIHSFPDMLPNYDFWKACVERVIVRNSSPSSQAAVEMVEISGQRMVDLAKVEAFAKLENPKEADWDADFDTILNKIADENELICSWALTLPLLQMKLRKIVTGPLLDNLMLALNSFADSPPFTLQRLCELLQRPTEHHKTESKLHRAIEKVLSITSSTPPSSAEKVTSTASKEVAMDDA